MKSFYSKLAGFLTVLALIVAFSGIAMSQTETGSVLGVVTDPSGAVVPKAKVTLKSVGTGAERSTVTDENGSYVFTNVLPAVYSVTVEAGGFAKVERRVQVTVGSKVTQDVALTIGAAQQILEITAEAGIAVNTETQTISQVIDTKKILELPTVTRNPYDLAATAGNVSGGDPSGRGVGVAINGQRAAGTNILLDGSANNNEFVASVGQSVPLDAVQEFSMITNNFTAEYGRASGGIVNVATKAGTNEYHGTAYEFNRISKLASWSFLDKAQGRDTSNNPLNPKQRFTRNQFGYSVGGPVMPSLKDKLFFFQSTEWTRVRSFSNLTVVVPTPQLIAASNANTQAFFTAFGTLKPGLTALQTFTRNDFISGGVDTLCNTTGPCASLPLTTPVFNKVTYVVPNDSGGGNPQNTYDLVGRVDWVMNSKTTMYSRYALEKGLLLPGVISNSPYAGFDTGETTTNNNILVSLNRQWTNRLTSQSKIVYNRLNVQDPHGASPSTPTLYFRTVTTRFLGNRAALPGYLPFSPGSGIPFGGPQNVGQVYQDLSYIRGKHQLRFGGSYVYIQDNRVFGAYQDPSQTLGSSSKRAMDAFLNGVLLSFQAAVFPQGKLPCRFTIIPGQPCGQDLNADSLITGSEIDPSGTLTLPVGQPDFSRSNRYHEFAVYGQDSWRIHPRLTLNLGMRWEYYGIQHNKDANKDSNYYDGSGGSVFDQIRNGGVATTPNSPIGGLWAKDWNNFAPRIGFAWDVFGNGKTSLRGGYGVGYERNFGNVTFNVIQNPPNYAVISLTAPIDLPVIPISTNVAGPLSGTSGVKALPRVSLRNVKSDIRTAYAHLWSLSVEREVLKNLFVEVDYSGSKGEKLYSLENPNRPGAGNVFLGDSCTIGNPFSCTSRLINTRYTNINRRGGKAESFHNALNVRVSSKNIYNTGLAFTANYTWAHSIDNLSSTFSESGNNFNLGLLDPFNPKLDRGSADFDIRHRFVFSGIWEIPFAKNMKGPAYYILHGWELSPIFTAETGTPFTVFDCNDAFFSVCPRAFLSGTTVTRKGSDNPPADPSTPGTFTYIDLAGQVNVGGFLNPITGSSEFGPYPKTMTARNFFRGPGDWNLNIGIYKTTKVTERFSIQLRGELFNTFNHANAGVLGSELDVSSQSVVRTQKNGRRNVQLAVKLIF